ncbi:MAG: PKD domain-containing protein [Bacteroidota bacterium]
MAKYTSFGESSTCSCTLLPNYDKGYVMIHEVGHWLGLYHTFEGGCAGTTAADCALAGDQVCDTPPVAAPNFGCPGAWSVNSCQGTPHDLLDNFMDYTNDACKSAFTGDQETRMLNAISNFRQTLVSAQNHQHTGISCVPIIVFSEFTASNFNPCLGESVTFTATPVTGATYDWDFGDLNSGTGASVTHAYSITAPQQFDVTLTVTVNGQSVSSSKKVFFTPCTVTNCSQGNWYFGNFAALDFSSGSPQATFGSGLATIEGTVTESLPNCGLVYYSNGIYVWDHQHNRINPTQPLTGHVSTAQSALSIPDPGGSDDYFLFTLPVNFNTTDPWAFSRVVVTLNGSGTAVNNVALTNINTPIALPAGINGLSEAQTAIEKCNNEYWILVKENAPNGAMLVYSFTSTGIAHVATVPASGHGTGSTTMSFSRDGATLMVSELGGSWISLFDFDRSTGTLSNERHIVTSQQVYGASFSPDSRYVYLSEGVAQPEIVQYDRQSANFQSSRRYVGDAVHYINNIRIGPDDKLYLSNYGIRYLSVINYPNERVTPLAPNACGYNPDGPSVENPSPGSTNPFVQGGLPWYISAQPAALVPLEITHAMVNCSTVVFQAPDCNGPYSWDFGDPASGSNTASAATATHTFSSDGNYLVTLQAGSNTRTANLR